MAIKLNESVRLSLNLVARPILTANAFRKSNDQAIWDYRKNSPDSFNPTKLV